MKTRYEITRSKNTLVEVYAFILDVASGYRKLAAEEKHEENRHLREVVSDWMYDIAMALELTGEPNPTKEATLDR